MKEGIVVSECCRPGFATSSHRWLRTDARKCTHATRPARKEDGD